ncbi:2OG-Fe(II) oxygenase [Cohnella zeiphila]|uniref:2OG-Fe(II) oxygenase n=1 Tax=Cohnella zeiphila TaxID=2761120 RepID=A0A7X0W132_9BACL|nr:2OG-Fe(II) oxygenase [Cohnella zeiphila]MBB6735668.1 2OG-Fe(II) oxygenase [Cohnella zeiphila]
MPMSLSEFAPFLDRQDETGLQRELDESGFARLPGLLNEAQCAELVALYEDESRFRRTIDMNRYRFGSGEYKYFAAPLPALVQQLRERLYPALARAANRWEERLGQEPAYPEELSAFLEQCHRHGQTRPTPLLLKYEEGDYNCLHQDLYGEVFFPFQAVIALSRRDLDYAGGEFLLVEQRPRAQSRGHALVLEQGDGLVFPTNNRPVAGARGYYRTKLRHGVSTVLSGRRHTLGVIFHDAR